MLLLFVSNMIDDLRNSSDNKTKEGPLKKSKNSHDYHMKLRLKKKSERKFKNSLNKNPKRESPVVRSSSLRREVRPEIQEFFAATSQSPTYTMSSANYPLSPRDDLPPPSGEEQIGISPNHNGTIPKVAPKPTKKPVPIPDKQKPPKPGIVPRTKPKPAVKPVRSFGNSNGQMDDLTSNIGRVSMNAPSQIQGDQDEQVTSSKSRDFFKRQEVDTSPNNSLTRDRTASNSSSSSNTSNETRTRAPLGSSRPPLTKMKPALSTEQRSFGDAPPTPPKKVPPPAPPKRRSSSKTKETKAPEVTIIHNPPSPQPPSPQLSDFLPPPPLVSPPPKDISEPSSPLPPPPSSLPSSSEMGMGKITPEPSPAADNQAANIEQNPPKKENVDESFSETENIMADIMADIDDFSAQLDSMF